MLSFQFVRPRDRVLRRVLQPAPRCIDLSAPCIYHFSVADILVFGAHPDDAEFGMGASMVKFVRGGASLAVCVLTRGEAGTFGSPQQREAEMRAASETLGAELEILSFRDCQVQDTYEARLQVASVVRKYRPKVVFAPYHTNTGSHTDGSAHPDHMATGQIVRSALRYARFAGLKELGHEPWNTSHLFYYMVPASRKATLMNDVSPFMDEWEGIARRHESQVKIRDGKIMQILKALRAGYGVTMGVAYAEAFLADGPLAFDIAPFLGNAATGEARFPSTNR